MTQFINVVQQLSNFLEHLSSKEELGASYYGSIVESSKVCRSSVQFYDYSVSTQLIELILDIVHRARSRIKDAEWGNSETPYLNSVCSILCQTLSNFCATGDERLNNYVHQRLYRLVDIVAFAATCQSRRILAFIFAILLNNLFTTNENRQEMQEGYQKSVQEVSYDKTIHCPENNRLDLFLNNNSQLFKSILLAIIDIPIASTTGSESSDDPALEWAHLFIFKLLQCDVFPSFFSLVGSNHSLSEERKIATHEQVILLYLATCVVEDSHCAAEVTAQWDSSGGMHCGMQSLLTTLISWMDHHLSVNMTLENDQYYPLNNTKHAKDDEVIERFETLQGQSLQLDFIAVSLQFIGAVLALAPTTNNHWESALRQKLTSSSELMKICCEKVLAKRNPLTAGNERVVERCQSGSGNNNAAAVIAALQVLANLLPGCKDAQDQLRDSGGLAIVLSNCFTDFNNPFAREWALVCIRNACEGNSLNQAYIESLQPEKKLY